MKWYDVHCPRCQWKAEMVDERVAQEFYKLSTCRDCKKAGHAVQFQITERITNTPGKGQR